MDAATTRQIRIGALLFLASGVLTIIGLTVRGPIYDQTAHPLEWAQAAVSARHNIAWALLFPNLVIQIFGFLGVWGFLRGSRVRRSAYWGTMLSIAGNAVYLPFAGIDAFIAPLVAERYLAGDKDALKIVTAGMLGPFAGPFFAGSALLLLLGCIIFSVAIWRSGTLPKWSAPMYLLHSVLLTFVAPLSYALEYTGAILLLVSAAWIAVAIWRQTAQPATTAQPRAVMSSEL